MFLRLLYVINKGAPMSYLSFFTHTPYLMSTVKILVAAFIGGIIGLERETVKRPAGFRTHILVCVAAAMIMDVNIQLASEFSQVDPTRLGAQVISGMGFLGAGTIIKEGASVKGLTTAAGLWAVACLGLAVGSGYISIAVWAMLIMLLTLKTFSSVEKHLARGKRIVELNVYSDLSTERIGVITVVLGSFHCKILHLNIDPLDDGRSNRINVTYELAHGVQNEDVLKKLHSMEGIISIESVKGES
jgi:putative Mg2+ transporter-C (MgtC) family protein